MDRKKMLLSAQRPDGESELVRICFTPFFTDSAVSAGSQDMVLSEVREDAEGKLAFVQHGLYNPLSDAKVIADARGFCVEYSLRAILQGADILSAYVQANHWDIQELYLLPNPGLEKKVEDHVPRFDPDVAPNNAYNKDVAQKLGLKYDPKGKVYRDADGCPVRDEFGQDLG